MSESGKTLDASRLRECEQRKVPVDFGLLERGYKIGLTSTCKPEVQLAKGQTGAVPTFSICPADAAPKLKQKYMDGLNQYCVEKNIFKEARDGKAWTGVCENRPELKRQFNYGRSAYLVTLVATLEAQSLSKQAAMNQVAKELPGLKASADNYQARLQNKEVGLGESILKTIADPEREYEEKNDQYLALQKEKMEIDERLVPLKAEQLQLDAELKAHELEDRANRVDHGN